MAMIAQSLKELASLAELLGPGALREVAADHDEVGFQLIGLPLDGLDQLLVVRAEMQVGKMHDASHGPSTEGCRTCFRAPPCAAGVGRGTIHRRVNGGGVKQRRSYPSTSFAGSPPHRFAAGRINNSA